MAETRAPEKVLLEQLRLFSHRPVERYVLARGRPYRAARLPGAIRRGRADWCYENAGRYLQRHASAGLKYIEGFAFGPPVDGMSEQAWLITEDDVVVDRQWPDPDQCAYFGVAFERREYLELVKTSGTWKVLHIAARAWSGTAGPVGMGQQCESRH